MRKPRILLYDDDPLILDILTQFLLKRGYQVYSYNEPVICPIYENFHGNCANLAPCADLMISDFQMPKMTGTELFRLQATRECRVNSKMKAILSGCSDESLAAECDELGCGFLQKPFHLSEISAWLTKCEAHFDLSQPLNNRRMKARYGFRQDIEYYVNLASDKNYSGTTCDKSIDGLGLHTNTPLLAGDNLRIIKGLNGDHLTGEVRWCKKQDVNTYRAGLLLL